MISGYNIHDDFGQKQCGGTFLLGNGDITTSISDIGRDTSGLGQWVWVSLSDRTGTTMHIISAYCPSKSSQAQTNSIHAQHQSYLLSQMNGNIHKAEITDFCNNLGLLESILSAHPTLLPPVTFKYVNQVGRSPIDGVWISATLPTAASSFCPFSLHPGDHQAAILDLDLALLIGEPHLSLVRQKACHLNMQLPQTKAHYLAILEEFFHSKQLLPQLSSFIKMQPNLPLMQPLQALNLNTSTNFTSKVCTWLRSTAGSYTWVFSPTLTLWFNQKILWSLIHK